MLKQPTDIQLEAGAKAVRVLANRIQESDPEGAWSDCYPSERQAWREATRAAQQAFIDNVPVTERCDDCGDKLEYVAGMDGEGGYPHCWRCWYRDNTPFTIQDLAVLIGNAIENPDRDEPYDSVAASAVMDFLKEKGLVANNG